MEAGELKTSRLRLVAKEHTGLIGNIIIGLVGAALGHFVAPMIGVEATNQIGSILVSVGGAALLIVILRGLKILK